MSLSDNQFDVFEFANRNSHPNLSDLTIYDKALYVVSCGNFSSITSNSLTQRPMGREDYHIIYIKSGHCHFILNNEAEFDLNAGDIMFVDYNIPHEYTYFCHDDPCFYWIHFKGDLARHFVKDLNLKSDKISVDNSPWIESCFKTIMYEYLQRKPMYLKRATSTFVSLITHLAEKHSDKSINKYNDINQIISFMRASTHMELSLEDYAAMCHLSKSRFIKKFKAVTGMTPFEFRNECLIANMKWYLKNTTLSINAISNTFGFLNVSYCSLLFKQNTGKSPFQYRKEYKESIRKESS